MTPFFFFSLYIIVINFPAINADFPLNFFTLKSKPHIFWKSVDRNSLQSDEKNHFKKGVMCAIPFNTCNWICVALLISRNFFHSYEKEKTNSFKEKKWKWSPKKKEHELFWVALTLSVPYGIIHYLRKKMKLQTHTKFIWKKILKKPDLHPPRIFSYLTYSFFSIHKSFCVLIQNFFFFDNHTPSILLLSLAQFFFSVSVLFGFNSHHLTKKCVDCKMKMKMLKNRLSKILMIGSIFHSAPDSVFLNRNVKFDT